MKTCNKCGQSKPATSEFFGTKTNTRKDGTEYTFFTSPCRECRTSAQRARYFAGGDDARRQSAERVSRSRSKNGRGDRTAELEKQRIKRAGGADQYEAKKRVAALRKMHSLLSGLLKQKRSELPRKGLDAGFCWLWQNPALSEAEQYRVRYASDPDFNLSERIRRQINKKRKQDSVGELMRGALLRGGESNMVHELLGYTIAQLRAHLERQFIRGMTWESFMRGEIHIDHIVPQSSFNLSDTDEWRECWSLSNLQPLWAADNLRKSNKPHFLL